MDPLETLARLPASDVKKRGWRGVMRTVRTEGTVVVTNHEEPEAVIIQAHEYTRLRALVNRGDATATAALETLRRDFDARLASLDAPDAADRLLAVARQAARLRGRVKAGQSH